MSRIKQLATNDDGFCFDPRTGDTFQLNPTAQVVFNVIKGGLAIDVAAQKLTELFDVSIEDALSDAQEFVQLLRIHGLVEA